VSNRHLYNLAIKLGLQQVVVERKLEPSVSWQPPGYSRQALDDVLIDLDSRFPSLVDVVNSRNLGGGSLLHWLRQEDLELIQTSKEEDHTEVKEILLNRAVERLNQKEASELSLRSYKLVSDKSLADCMEALIGAFLVHSGQKMTFRAMAGLGINLSAETSLKDVLEGQPSVASHHEDFPPQGNAFRSCFAQDLSKRSQRLYGVMMAETVEEILGYSFKERSFLVQALTHASYTSNELTESYERLEFLGDAVLDYLVTAHIFSSSYCEDAKPGQMTDCRSALVNNNLLAALVVNANLHPFLLHHSPELMQKVTSFVDAWKESGQNIENVFGLINEDEAVSQVKD